MKTTPRAELPMRANHCKCGRRALFMVCLESVALGRMLSGDAVLHPAVLLDEMNTEIHRFCAFLARSLFGLVSIAGGRGCRDRHCHGDDRQYSCRGDK